MKSKHILILAGILFFIIAMMTLLTPKSVGQELQTANFIQSERRVHQISDDTYLWFTKDPNVIITLKIINDNTAVYTTYNAFKSNKSTTFNKQKFLKGVK